MPTLTSGSVTVNLNDKDGIFFLVNKWFVNGDGYCDSFDKGRLCRIILERKIGRPLRPGETADHINGNTLDDRRENLRIANSAQQNQNRRTRRGKTSRFKGVRRQKNGWLARICAYGKRYSSFHKTELEAFLAYTRMAIKYHGQFRRLF